MATAARARLAEGASAYDYFVEAYRVLGRVPGVGTKSSAPKKRPTPICCSSARRAASPAAPEAIASASAVKRTGRLLRGCYPRSGRGPSGARMCRKTGLVNSVARHSM